VCVCVERGVHDSLSLSVSLSRARARSLSVQSKRLMDKGMTEAETGELPKAAPQPGMDLTPQGTISQKSSDSCLLVPLIMD
jgi:hypothetical protein